MACLAAAGAALALLPVAVVMFRSTRLPGDMTRGLSSRLAVTVAAAVFSLGSVTWWVVSRPAVSVPPAPAGFSLTGPGLLFRDTTTGRLAVQAPDQSRLQSSVTCARAHTAGGIVGCLQPNDWGQFELVILDRSLSVLDSVPLNGVPSRVRLSPSGRLVGFSTFVSGDSYASSKFSTRSGILDRASGEIVPTLEDFTVDGRQPSIDANFWGITFASDDNTFYATMATGRHHYLVRGDVAARTLTVLDDGVECPSLSPDGTRLAYKRRLPNKTWQLWVYDLRDRRRTQLAEPQPVDDQALWLDDGTVAYTRRDLSGENAVWSVPADGSGHPVRMVDQAESPSLLA